LSETIDYARGDETGILMPAHEAALRMDGAAFLTEAFRAFGSIAPDNSVVRITRLDPCPGGSTGHKLFLTVDYAHGEPGLQRELFVKFSRDFADSRRDHARYEMESEARFAPVSRALGFPIRVPTAYFGDFEHASGTGLLITEQVAFGRDGIEAQHQKCCDDDIAAPLPYYEALITALARLAAAYKAGELGGDIDQRFPYDPAHAGLDPIAHEEPGLRKVIAGARQFAQDLPQLLPAALRDVKIYDGVLENALRVLAHQDELRTYLLGNPDLVALCHWNAHIDNAWFWRDGQGALQCGLMDWGRVSQITFGAALWGCLSAAHLDMARDLDALIAMFVEEYTSRGGPAIGVDDLRQHFFVHVGIMGVARVLSLPKVVRMRVPDASRADGPRDPMIRDDEAARTVLHIYTMLLTLWTKPEFTAALDRTLNPALT
jgi:hypothetical protein